MKVSLKKYGGAVKIDIDGKVLEPLSFKSFRPSAKNISDFYKAGVRVFDILSSGIICMLGVPYSLFGESWVDDDTYDFGPVDAQIDLFVQNAPEAYFALMIQMDTREWYVKKHAVPYSFTHLSQVIADEKWKEAAKRYLRAVIDHVEEKYKDRFYGYFLLGGMTTEWFSANDNEESHPIKLEAFRKYLNDDNAIIPEMSRREIPKERLFLDPKSEKDVVVYRKFHNELISSTICEFAKVVKEQTNYNKLCGVYFGYLFELHGPRLWNAGSIDYETVYNCPYVDMISSPSSYGDRAYNDTSAVMVTSDTLDERDKLYFLEFDHITHLAPKYVPDGNGILIPGGDSKFENESQTIDVMRRDFMLCCARRLALWWFDMFEGWFYSDGMMNEVKKFIDIQNELTKRESKSVSEICYIAEGGESLYYVNKNALFNTHFLGRQRDGLNRIGAPFDIYSICDLEKIDFDRYKLFIFANSFKMSEKTRNIINKKIKAKGKTVLWYAGPDCVADNEISALKTSQIMDITVQKDLLKKHTATYNGKEFGEGYEQETFVADDKDVKVLCEFSDGAPAVSYKDTGKYKSVFSSIGNLPGKLLQDIARLAGVHIYSDDCPVYVNSVVKGVYLNKDEGTTLYVDDGEYVDLFSKREYKSINGKLELPFVDYRAVMLVKK